MGHVCQFMHTDSHIRNQKTTLEHWAEVQEWQNKECLLVSILTFLFMPQFNFPGYFSPRWNVCTKWQNTQNDPLVTSLPGQLSRWSVPPPSPCLATWERTPLCTKVSSSSSSPISAPSRSSPRDPRISSSSSFIRSRSCSSSPEGVQVLLEILWSKVCMEEDIIANGVFVP